MANKISPDQLEAGLQQMQINTRLTSLQTALSLMATPQYSGAVDHITLLAISEDVAKFILGNLETEALKAIEEARKPTPVRPHIMRP